MKHTIKVELTIDGKQEYFEFIEEADPSKDYSSLGKSVNFMIAIRSKSWRKEQQSANYKQDWNMIPSHNMGIDT